LRDGGEKAAQVFVVSGCDAAELSKLAEEALDQIALAIDPCAEGKAGFTVPFCRNVGACLSLFGQVSQGLPGRQVKIDPRFRFDFPVAR